MNTLSITLARVIGTLATLPETSQKTALQAAQMFQDSFQLYNARDLSQDLLNMVLSPDLPDSFTLKTDLQIVAGILIAAIYDSEREVAPHDPRGKLAAVTHLLVGYISGEQMHYQAVNAFDMLKIENPSSIRNASGCHDDSIELPTPVGNLTIEIIYKETDKTYAYRADFNDAGEDFTSYEELRQWVHKAIQGLLTKGNIAQAC